MKKLLVLIAVVAQCASGQPAQSLSTAPAPDRKAASDLSRAPLGDAIRSLQEVGAPSTEPVPPPITIKPPTSAVPALQPVPSAVEVPRGYKAPVIPLSRTAQGALNTGRAWASEPSAATLGADGRVLYTFGQGLPEVVCAPFRVCVVELQAGERIIGPPQAGDTVRWAITPASMGEGLAQTELIVIKPNQDGLDTNLVVATSRRMYYLRLVSRSVDYVARVAFTYPEDAKNAWAAHDVAQAQKERRAEANKGEEMAAGGIESLFFDYVYEGSDDELKPARTFDDGTKTYVQMSSLLRNKELPNLIVIGSNGKPEIVNYRVKGTLYIVDRLFDRAALLLGVGSSQRKIVIVRATAKRSFKWPWQKDEFESLRLGEAQ